MPSRVPTGITGVALGDVVAGKYELVRVLGAGGMGTVFLARHTELGGYFALKFLASDYRTHPQAVERFRREARAAAKLKSEHVVRVFDVGKHGDGIPYMVMEYLEGEDLAKRIREKGPLPVEQAVEFLREACLALGEAHREGIVHRDLKPSNLIIARTEGGSRLKVVDFGISKLAAESLRVESQLTSTGAFIGSLGYMSPEQMKSPAQVDARTDVWSLGVVLYEALTGKAPFTAETYPELCLKIHGEPPVPPRVLRACIPEGLEAAILRCLEKVPGARTPSVQALAEDLRPFGAFPVMPATLNPTFVASKEASQTGARAERPNLRAERARGARLARQRRGARSRRADAQSLEPGERGVSRGFSGGDRGGLARGRRRGSARDHGGPRDDDRDVRLRRFSRAAPAAGGVARFVREPGTGSTARGIRRLGGPLDRRTFRRALGARSRADRARFAELGVETMSRSFQRVSSRVLGVLALSLWALPSARAETSSDPKRAEAERLFVRATQRMDARDYAEACPLLEQSQALDASSGTLLNLGDCYEQIGRSVRAWRAFRDAHELSLASDKLDRAKVAELRMNRLAKRVRFVQVILPARAFEALRVALDDEVVPPARLRAPIAVDAGTHVLRASAPGFLEHRAQIAEGSLGETTTYRLPELARPAPPVKREARAPRALDGQQIAAIAAAAVGGAGVAVGTVFGLRSLDKHRESDGYCDARHSCEPRGVESMDEARRAGNVATGAFIVGAAGLGAAAVLWFVRPFGDEAAPRVALDVGPGALGVRGRF